MSTTTLTNLVTYVGVRTLVLGATGFIGRHVTRALVNAGAQVTVSSDDARALELMHAASPKLEVAVCDVVNESDVAHLLRQLQPTITFNLAGYGVDPVENDEELAQRINAELPVQLAAVLRERARRDWPGQTLVHVGTAAEYGTARNDLREDTIGTPITLYGRTKLAGTTALSAETARSGLRALTARLFTVYGPGERAGRLLPSLLETARTRTPLALTAGQQQRDFTYVGDVVKGLMRLGVTKTEPGAIVNLATGRLTSVREFAERAARVLRIEPSLLRFGKITARAEEMQHEPVSIARLVEWTRWSPPTLIEEGVRLTAEAQA